MPNINEPMIKLEPGGKAPILSYNVPEPTTYFGRNFIELSDFDEKYFKDEFCKSPPQTTRSSIKGLDLSTLKTAVSAGMKSGFTDSKLFPNIRFSKSALNYAEKSPLALVVDKEGVVTPGLANLNPEIVATKMQNGERLNIYRTMFGTYTHNFVPEPVKPRPRLLLVETYKLTSYLGNYGAGKTIKTYSLFPGETTKISIRTYSRRETESKSASCILDSFTQESSDDFETAVQNEQSNKEAYAQNFEYHAEAEAKASWGWGSAKASGGVKGGTNSSREEFSKNVSSSLEKHSMTASAKRDVQINTSYQVKEETGSETSIEREIENINVSRTLNLVFRQMNQEFITLLHLVDIRIAFFNGYAESKKEVTLAELDSLLEEVIVNNTKIQEVKKAIIEQLENIFDYQDQHHDDFVEEKPLKDKAGNDIPKTKYLHVKKGHTSTYTDPDTGAVIVVPGIIMSCKKNVLRTDGVIVEAILGQGDALDKYSHKLQDESGKSRELQNTLLETEIERNKLGLHIVKNKDEKAAKLFAQVFPAVKKSKEDEEEEI